MYKHAEKIEDFLKQKTRLIDWYNYKYPQMAYQGLYIIVIGSVAYGKGGTCSAPINIFLQGLFTMYIIAFSLNILVFLTRYLNSHSENGSFQRKAKNLALRVELCYFPLYWGFSILEFIWYVLGAEWVTEDNNCMEKYPDGARLTKALVVLWVLAMIGILSAIIAVNCYLCCGRYSGQQTLGPEVIMDYPINDLRSHPESPKIINPTFSNTPARDFDD